MSALLGSAAIGLPALLGVVLGLRLYMGGLCWVGGALLAALACGAAVWAGRAQLRRRPRLGCWLIDAAYVLAILVTALGTALVAWVVLNTPLSALGDTTGLSEDAEKHLKGAFAGAVSTYVAVAWLKEIGDAKGAFWPSTHFRAGMAAAYERLNPKPASDTAAWEAIFSDTVTGHGNLGWDRAARHARAAILAAFLAAPPANPPGGSTGQTP